MPDPCARNRQDAPAEAFARLEQGDRPALAV